MVVSLFACDAGFGVRRAGRQREQRRETSVSAVEEIPLPVLPPVRLDRGRQIAWQLYDWLRAAIIDLVLKPGAVLSRAELVGHLGVSATPVRDALSRLADETLVEVFPQHATVVAPIDLALVAQAHFHRRALELEVIRTLAPRRDATLVVALRRSLERQRARHASEDFAGLAHEDQSFHQLLYEAAGAGDLWLLLRSRSGHLDRLRRLHLPAPGKAVAILHDHAAILDALEAGDCERAEAATRAHLAGTVANADEIRRRHPAYIRA